MSKFLHDSNNYTKAVAIPRVFSENSRAENNHLYLISCLTSSIFLTPDLLPSEN